MPVVRSLTPSNLLGRDEQRGATRPVLRSTGDMLQPGDRWWDTSENRWWFWSSPYWLSEQRLNFVYGLQAGISATFFPGGLPVDVNGNDFYLEQLQASVVQQTGTWDASNYWEIRLTRVNPSDNAIISGLMRFDTQPATVRTNQMATYNIHHDVSALDIRNLRFVWARVGNPGNLAGTSSAVAYYRWAKP